MPRSNKEGKRGSQLLFSAGVSGDKGEKKFQMAPLLYIDNMVDLLSSSSGEGLILLRKRIFEKDSLQKRGMSAKDL